MRIANHRDCKSLQAATNANKAKIINKNVLLIINTFLVCDAKNIFITENMKYLKISISNYFVFKCVRFKYKKKNICTTSG